MKKVFFIMLGICTTITLVNAQKVYLSSNIEIKGDVVTNSDNYNYDKYLLDRNQILIVPKEDGILSNDIISNKEYKIVILENNNNSKLGDLLVNKSGSFTYIPSSDVVGEISYKYYIEYDNKKSNVSYIYFYVKNTITEYVVNYLDKETLREIAPSIIRKGNVNKKIIEKPIEIDDYYSIGNSIEKKLKPKKEENIFNFYYKSKSIPNTGLWKNE